jgi:hypothetical protein
MTVKYNCALQLEGCFETTVGYRGVCSNCYKKLCEDGIIEVGDRFNDFPDWLKEFVRLEAAADMQVARHPTESYDGYREEQKLAAKAKNRIPLGVEGCYKIRRITSPSDQIVLKQAQNTSSV